MNRLLLLLLLGCTTPSAPPAEHLGEPKPGAPVELIGPGERAPGPQRLQLRLTAGVPSLDLTVRDGPAVLEQRHYGPLPPDSVLELPVELPAAAADRLVTLSVRAAGASRVLAVQVRGTQPPPKPAPPQHDPFGRRIVPLAASTPPPVRPR
jgi:hypothetical protein